jgi:hypothetical protein
MDIEFFFRIDSENSKHQEISKILKILATRNDVFWELSSTRIGQIDKFVESFVARLFDRKEQLKEIGVCIKSDVSFWFYYQYDEQCNLNFSSSTMKLLGNAGIELSISCWKDNQLIEVTDV